MEIRERIKEIALKELFYKEELGNRTKFGKWFGLDGVPWCGIFVSWVYDQAGIRIKGGGFTKGFAGCQTFAVNFKTKETQNPEQGDIVLFDWNSDGRFDHVGIYLSSMGGEVIKTVEGNTSNTNNSNGGMVLTRLRNKRVCKFYKLIENE